MTQTAKQVSYLLGFPIPDLEEEQSDMQKLMIKTWAGKTKGPCKGMCKICGTFMPSTEKIIVFDTEIYPNQCPKCQTLVDDHYNEQEAVAKIVESEWDLKCPSLFKDIINDPWSDSPINWSAFNEVKAWTPSRLGLYITGDSGKGKTASLWALFRELTRINDLSVVFVESIQMAERLSLSAKDLNSAYVDELASADVLLIDDLGKEKYTPTITAKIYDIINRRYKNQMPVIVTSRYGGDALQARLGVSQDDNMGNDICRRLGEMVGKVEF